MHLQLQLTNNICILDSNLEFKYPFDVQNTEFRNVYNFEICFRELGIFAEVEHKVALINIQIYKTINITVGIVMLHTGYNIIFYS